MRVLVVEDEPYMAGAIRDGLHRASSTGQRIRRAVTFTTAHRPPTGTSAAVRS